MIFLTAWDDSPSNFRQLKQQILITNIHKPNGLEIPLNHDFPMVSVFLWFSHGSPMVLLWFSYGLTHGFTHFPWRFRRLSAQVPSRAAGQGGERSRWVASYGNKHSKYIYLSLFTYLYIIMYLSYVYYISTICIYAYMHHISMIYLYI